MKLGVHVSVAGSIDLAVDRAVDFGCNTFQIFVSNPRGWKPSVIAEKDAELFKIKYKAAKMDNAVAHGIYLINLAGENDYNREMSIESLISGLINTEKLGLAGLVTHIGSYRGITLEKGIERVVDAVQTILSDATGSVPLLLENTAGAGNLVGDKFEEIGAIIDKVNSDRLGFCLDTAHAFESGYPIHTKEGLDETINIMEQEIGLDRLKAIHLNDSMTELNSKRDRHETFGKGFIGLDGMTRIINHPKLKDIPFIMETPELKKGEAGKEVVDYVRRLST
jgi:deoxyribonuclease-4